jgi:acyl-CoA thioesterase II
VIYQVDRLQDGRAFSRRRVTAIQDGRPILCLESSFTTDQAAAEHHAAPPARGIGTANLSESEPV